MIAVLRKQADPAHGRAIPIDPRLAAVLRRYWKRQWAEIAPRVQQGQRVQLDQWTQPMTEALAPLLKPHFIEGGQEAARRIRRLLLQRRERAYATGIPGGDGGRLVGGGAPALRAGVGGLAALGDRGLAAPWRAGHSGDGAVAGGWRKNRPAAEIPDLSFDVFNPRVLEAVDRLTFDFCAETNRTSVERIDLALRALRRELAGGLEEGEAYLRLTRRVLNIFASPARAAAIGMTEPSRAMHAGQLLMAKDSGVVKGKRWLASSDACPLCLSLNGIVVGLDEDFAVVGKGPYSRVPHAPAHPHCMCTWTEVLS